MQGLPATCSKKEPVLGMERGSEVVDEIDRGQGGHASTKQATRFFSKFRVWPLRNAEMRAIREADVDGSGCIDINAVYEIWHILVPD